MSDPAEVMQITARLLGTHLGVNRCAYAEVDADEDHFTLTGDFSQGVDSIVGRYTFSQFGLDCLQLMRANLPYVVHDIDTDPRAAGMDLSAYRLTAIQAVICVPLHKDGRFVAAMAVHQRTPRRWNKQEIELVQLVCSRCWESLQRTRAHHAMQLTNERLNIALAAAEMGDWSWSAATDVVSLSPRAAALFGVPVAPITWHELAQLIHEDDRERTLGAVQASVRSGMTYREEYRLAGSRPPRWLAVWGTPQTDDAGAVAGIFGVVQESTARKQMEQDLREADQKKDEFLAVLAHELRNPLAPIGLAAQMLRQSPDPATQNTAELIRTQVVQISRLLDDLLDTSRIKTGRMTVKKELVYARTAIDLALQNTGPELRRRSHTVTLQVEDDLALQADPVRLAQIITNLLTNAAKYTRAGAHPGERVERRRVLRVRGQRQRDGADAAIARAHLRDVLAGGCRAPSARGRPWHRPRPVACNLRRTRRQHRGGERGPGKRQPLRRAASHRQHPAETGVGQRASCAHHQRAARCKHRDCR
nr:histidine kinase dimerization/phospho-acceptor domain-containing protein [Variovorax sp. S12S4]